MLVHAPDHTDPESHESTIEMAKVELKSNEEESAATLESQTEVEEEKKQPSFWSRVSKFIREDLTKFVREDLLSFYESGIPYKSRKQEIAVELLNTLFAGYAAWGAFEQSNQQLKSYVDGYQSATVLLTMLNSLFSVGTFLFMRKMGGKTIYFLRHQAKRQEDQELWLKSLTNKLTQLCDSIADPNKSQEALQRDAKEISAEIKTGRFINRPSLFSAFSFFPSTSRLTSSSTLHESPPSTPSKIRSLS